MVNRYSNWTIREKTSVACQNLESLKRHGILLRTIPLRNTITVLDVQRSTILLIRVKVTDIQICILLAHDNGLAVPFIELLFCEWHGPREPGRRFRRGRAFNIASTDASSEHSIKDFAVYSSQGQILPLPYLIRLTTGVVTPKWRAHRFWLSYVEYVPYVLGVS